MTRNTRIGLAAAGGILGLLLITGATRKKKQQSTLARPGQTVERHMGAMFIVRLPRGQYDLLGGDNFHYDPLASLDSGTSTDIVLTPLSRPLGYTAKLIFSNQDDPSDQYKLTVIVKE